MRRIILFIKRLVDEKKYIIYQTKELIKDIWEGTK